MDNLTPADTIARCAELAEEIARLAHAQGWNTAISLHGPADALPESNGLTCCQSGGRHSHAWTKDFGHALTVYASRDATAEEIAAKPKHDEDCPARTQKEAR